MILLLLLLVLPLVRTQPCAATGMWTEWTRWTDCPSGPSSLMNFQTRIRNCLKQPDGCVLTTAYSCPGTYSEVSFCGLDTTKQPAAQPTATSPSQQTSTSTVPITTTAPATVSLTTILTTSTPTTRIPDGSSSSSEETTRAQTPETTTGPSTESSQPSTTAWEEMTTVTDLSDSTEPMGTMPTETMPPPAEETTARMETTAQTEEPIDDTTEMSDSTDLMSTMPAEPSTVIDDEPTTAQAAEETTEPVENPETTDMPEGTTDSGMSESMATRDMSEGTTSMPIIETTGFSDGMVETTEMETAESSMITDWEGETSAMMETTTGRTTCDDCPELNVYLYNENPYEDGASVLNRYTRSGCKYVQFFCRPYQMTDYRPVQTVFNNDVSNTELPPYVEMSCKNGQWWYENVAVTSLSCIYEPPPTTTTAMVTTWAPGDPNRPCMKCTQPLYVKPQNGTTEGAAYVDYRVEECLSAEIYCQPTKSRRFVEIYENGVSVGITGPSLNRTFTCNDEAQWVQLDTPIVVDNVSCVMEKGALPSTLTTMFTTRGDGMLSTTPWDWSTTTEYGGEETETTTESSRTTPGEGMPSTTPWDWSTTSEYGGEETESTTGSSRSTIPVEEPSTTEMMTDNSEEYPESTTPVGTDMSTAPPFTPSIPVTPSVPVSGTTTAIPQSTEPTTDMEITTDNWITGTENTVAQSTLPPETTSNSGVMTTQQETTTESEMETETPLVEASTTISEFTEGSTGPGSMGTTPMEPEVSTSRAATVENPVSITTSGSSTGGNSVIPPIITPVVGESTTTTLPVTTEVTAEPSITTGDDIIEETSTMEPASSPSVPVTTTPLVTTEVTDEASVTTVDDVVEETSTMEPASSPIVPVTTMNPVTTEVTTEPSVTTADEVIEETSTVEPASTPGVLVTTANPVTTEITAEPSVTTADDIIQGTSTMEPASSPIVPVTTPETTPEATTGESTVESSATPGEIVESTTAATTLTVENRPTEISTPGGPATTGTAQETTEDEQLTDITIMPSMGTTGSPQETTAMPSSTDLYTESVPTPGPTAGPSEPSAETTGTTTVEVVTTTTTSEPTTSSTTEMPTTTTTPTTTSTTTTSSPTTTTAARLPVSSTLPTTTTTPDKCSQCKNMVAGSLSRPGAYDGMIVLDHTTDDNGCRLVNVDCVPNTADQNATLIINGYTAVATGMGSHSMNFTCGPDGRWRNSRGVAVALVSCLAQETETVVTSYPVNTEAPTPPTTTATTTTTARPPGVEPCMACAPLSVVPLVKGYNNGFITLVTSTNGNCKTIELTCEGSDSSDNVALVISGTEFERGVGVIRTNLTCNDMMTWTTPNGYAVPLISCGIQIATTTISTTMRTTTTTPSTTTTTPSTTTILTTTTSPSFCSQCTNLQPMTIDQLTSGGKVYANGALILDHYVDFMNCRVVVIKCSADTGYEDATIIFNGNITVSSAPSWITTSLTCNQNGKWMRLNTAITTVSCRVTKIPSGITTAPPLTTTTIATTTTTLAGTAPCSNCNRMLVASVPSGYSSGFLTMNTFYTGQCINVDLSCTAPNPASRVALIDSSGMQLVNTVAQANLSLACNSAAKWVTPSNVTVETLSCALVEQTSTSTPATTTSTSGPEATTVSCSLSTWAEWQAWSNCTDTCGSCGSRQRFRACNKSRPDCLCEGTAYEKEVCNREVCKYPRPTACCAGYSVTSYQGQFFCMKAAARPVVI